MFDQQKEITLFNKFLVVYILTITTATKKIYCFKGATGNV